MGKNFKIGREGEYMNKNVRKMKIEKKRIEKNYKKRKCSNKKKRNLGKVK